VIHYARSLVLLTLVAVAAWLGFWQLDRMQSKQALIDQFKNAPEMDLMRAVEADNKYARVKVSGHYDPAWQFLVDNKINKGQVGVHVLSLFQPDYGNPVLVNRGWLPVAADRRTLPTAPLPKGGQVITGLLTRPNEDGIRLGDPQPIEVSDQAILITYLDMQVVSAAIGPRLLSRVILLDSNDPTGFSGRDWQPAVILPSQHKAYAVQWFALALAIAIVWVTLSWKSARKTGASQDSGGSDRRQPRE